MRSSLPSRLAPDRGRTESKPKLRPQLVAHVARAQIAGQEDHGLFEVHQRAVAQPQRAFIRARPAAAASSLGAAFSISSNSTNEDRTLRWPIDAQFLLRQHRLGLAMPQVSGRRADQLRHFVLHLKFAAVDLAAASSDCRAAHRPALPRSCVFPVPVGPSSRKTPAGRPSGVSRARYISTNGTTAAIAAGCPTSLRANATPISLAQLPSDRIRDRFEL